MATGIEALRRIVPCPPALFASHAKSCQRKRVSCWKCSWFTRGSLLRKRCVVPGTLTTWLSCCVKKINTKQTKKYTVFAGCELCRRYLLDHAGAWQQWVLGDSTTGRFGSYEVPLKELLQRGRTPSRHAKCRLHQLAVQHLQDNGAATSVSTTGPGPHLQEWESCFNGLCKGKSARDGGGQSDKVVLMRWCITESMLQLWRKQLGSARSLVLVRDERKGRMGLRFRACLQDFSVIDGVFGLEELQEGKKSAHIHAATVQALKSFCTSFHSPPRNYKMQDANRLDHDLLNHLKECCEMIVTDCAAAELLAQDMARGKRPLAVTVGPSRIGDAPADDLEGRHGDQATFPHVKVIGRDRAHACGRLIERPWKSDPFISTLLEAVFFSILVSLHSMEFNTSN